MPIIDTHAHVFPADFGPAPAGCDPAGWPAVEDGPDGSTKLLKSEEHTSELQSPC